MVAIKRLINTSILNSEWVGFQGDSEFEDEKGNLQLGYWTFKAINENCFGTPYTIEDEINEANIYGNPCKLQIKNENGNICNVELHYTQSQSEEDEKMKMTDRELDIIGQAYQNAYDERIENLKWINKSEMDTHTIAQTWQWFKIEELKGCMPNGETFDLLLALAMDIDRLDDMAREFPFINEIERLYSLMKENPKLHKQMDLSAFATYMEKWNGNVITYVINWILEREVKYFDYIIKEINNQTFDYITKEEWMENPYISFDGLTEIEVRR